MRFEKFLSSTLLLILFLYSDIKAQSAQTAFELTPELFNEMVKAYHPNAFKANLLTDKAKQKLREARGKFDPQLYSELDHKVFKKSQYFSNQESGIKIPTLGGVEFKAAFEKNEGVFLNPENSVPEQGLGIIGISIPVLQGMFTDQRRTGLRQAKSGQDMAQADLILSLNSLLYEAQSAYWEWAGAYYLLEALNEFENASRIRFEAIKNGYFQGDQAAIDTTEALIQWQEAQRMLQDTDAKYQKYFFDLQNFLWDERGVPLEVSGNLKPINFPELELTTTFAIDSLSDWMETQKSNHPKLQKFGAKQAILTAEKRLKIEKLKPKLNLEYNMLSQSADFGNGYFQQGMYENNYKFGFEAKFPLFLREARGSLNQTKIKLQENELDVWQAQQEIKNKVWTYFQQSELLNTQVSQYRETVGLYLRMVQAERTKFDNGESSLFLVNSRELKWISAREKYIKGKVTYFKTIAAFYEAMGTLHLQ